jgi:hypothetical protein
MAKIKSKNQNKDPKAYLIFGLFFTVMSLYKLTISRPIPRKVNSPKNNTENVCNNVLVVFGSNQTLESCVGLLMRL